MFFVMHCGGMPFDGNTIYQRSLGGSETAAFYMARELVKRGHKVVMFTNMQTPPAVFEGVHYMPAGQVLPNAPLGVEFHKYAGSQPHDVCIVQRHPQAFVNHVNSKVNLLWLHDLALYRSKVVMGAQLWNIDAVMAVSEFHRDQIHEVYGIKKENIIVVPNAVDLELFVGDIPEEVHVPDNGMFRLLYTSRPERGLINLVKKDGLMERLLKIDPSYHLFVCRYGNTTPQMVDFYRFLDSRVTELPNCTMLGNLNKKELANVMRQCDALVYPTEFEETFCITAVEAMAAGLPFIASELAAIPETCKGSGAKLIPLENGVANLPAFINVIKNLRKVPGNTRALQAAAVSKFTWRVSADRLIEHLADIFGKASFTSKVKNLWRNSDIYAFKRLTSNITTVDNAIEHHIIKDVQDSYQFMQEDDWGPHYAAYYQAEKDRGVTYGPESLDGNPRFEEVFQRVAEFISDKEQVDVLDYGCAHGHYTVNLAKRLPDHQFFGIDIEQSNIDTGTQWGFDEDLQDRVIFNKGDIDHWPNSITDKYDLIIAAEVVEHVADPMDLVQFLHDKLKPGGRLIITVPYGPWEAQGYHTFTRLGRETDLRAHVHHFERQDLRDMFGKCKNFKIGVIPAGATPEVENLGSYLVMFDQDDQQYWGEIDYERKLLQLSPRQTVTACMIIKDGANTLGKTLESIGPHMDELILAIDKTTSDHTAMVIEDFKQRNPQLPITVFDIPSPLEIGFDEARNLSIERASGDWVFWIDADEVLIYGERLNKYLRNNLFDGYCIKQHHHSIEPLGLVKTDFPCRLFRNHRDVRFFGRVHEHPGVNMNDGVGYAMLLHDVDIAHNSYITEEVRRKRFMRNMPLMIRDRKDYPGRNLGKMLWIRDLAQSCQYEMEMNGGMITDVIRLRCSEGIQLWESMLKDKENVASRMLVDFLDYYSSMVRILQDPRSFDYSFMTASDKMAVNDLIFRQKPITGHFLCQEHLKDFLGLIVNESTNDYGSRYF